MLKVLDIKQRGAANCIEMVSSEPRVPTVFLIDSRIVSNPPNPKLLPQRTSGKCLLCVNNSWFSSPCHFE